MTKSDKDLDGKDLPEGTVGVLLSGADIIARREKIFERVSNDIVTTAAIPFDPLTAVSMLSLGIGMLRYLGVTAATITTMAEALMYEHADLPSVPVEGRIVMRDELNASIEKNVQKCFIAPGNKTIN